MKELTPEEWEELQNLQEEIEDDLEIDEKCYGGKKGKKKGKKGKKGRWGRK